MRVQGTVPHTRLRSELPRRLPASPERRCASAWSTNTASATRPPRAAWPSRTARACLPPGLTWAASRLLPGGAAPPTVGHPCTLCPVSSPTVPPACGCRTSERGPGLTGDVPPAPPSSFAQRGRSFVFPVPQSGSPGGPEPRGGVQARHRLGSAAWPGRPAGAHLEGRPGRRCAEGAWRRARREHRGPESAGQLSTGQRGNSAPPCCVRLRP